MKIKPYIEKLGNSKAYAAFAKKYDNSFMVAGFFILDFETGQNIHQIDYYVPSEKKIAAFTLDRGVTMQMLNMMGKSVPEKLDINTKIDLDALRGILEDEMKNRSITEEIKKIIAVIQSIDGKKVWNINCVLSGMEILKAHVEDESQTILKMEKSSIMDYIKRMPAGQLKALQGGQMNQGNSKEDGEEGEAGMKGIKSEADTKEKIKKLEQLEAAIEKEKENLEKEAQKLPERVKSSAPKNSKKTAKSKSKKG